MLEMALKGGGGVCPNVLPHLRECLFPFTTITTTNSLPTFETLLPFSSLQPPPASAQSTPTQATSLPLLGASLPALPLQPWGPAGSTKGLGSRRPALPLATIGVASPCTWCKEVVNPAPIGCLGKASQSEKSL